VPLTVQGNSTRPEYLPLERYGLIGDSGTAALIADDGSIDWLCLPRFDSDPVFGRILDPAGGHFWLRPAEPFRSVQAYVADTAVLVTTFTTATGRATVYDFFAARGAALKRQRLWPYRYLVRRIEGETGAVPFRATLEPRDGFGHRSYRLSAHGCRVNAQLGGSAVLAEATAPFRVVGGRAEVELAVTDRSRAYVTLAYADSDVGVLPPAGAFAEEAFHETVHYWKRWAAQANLAGHRVQSLVLRSAITLKLLTFAPSGGVVAAPTTSLPEAIGGERNWDYRYVWVRDASRSIVALFDLGYFDEARAYLFWVTDAASLTQPRVHTMYDLRGEHRIPERTISWLRGYRDSRPVRKGNAAVDQLQLDNWGYLVDAAFVYAARGGSLDEDTWRSVRSFVEFVRRNWQRPDHGIWEVRSQPQHFVHSKVMSWMALDRGIRLVREFSYPGPVEAWERERDAVKQAVLSRGTDPEQGTLIRAFGQPVMDAALLEVPLVGFLPGSDPLVQRTIDRVRRELSAGDLLYRYRTDDGLLGNEGTFLPCSFWLVHALAIGGRREEACALLDRLAARANQLGLLPEEIDPAAGTFLGNFPQGLSHIALLNACVAVREF